MCVTLLSLRKIPRWVASGNKLNRSASGLMPSSCALLVTAISPQGEPQGRPTKSLGFKKLNPGGSPTLPARLLCYH